ncbi:hypothetical protein AALA52_03815 [Lactococcus ileimucosae]|uniref:Uncharacterized protein n=1 Tax=Lactococcus ileimucosae TaxID=2941329 RepID=A0ABV4D1D0_9LACT
MKKCRLCGKEAKLTEEHIPPKAAFNNVKRKLTRDRDSQDILLGEKTFEEVNGYYKKGQTFKTLCSSCNNFLGTEYVPEYVRLAVNLMYSYKKEGCLPKHNTYYFIEMPLRPLNFLKQVLSMFCSIVNEGFNEQFDFKNYILHKEENGKFSEKYKVGMYGFVGKQGFAGGPVIRINLDKSPPDIICKIEFVPFGFMLVNKEFEFPDGILDLDALKDTEYNREYDILFQFGIYDEVSPLYIGR